ncbi:peroxisomal sarcosine oxidase-like [Asterias amurensis]|uniref:peroxisomal sarcosine oxidase-like n=1 Tax=Asterias amurensis TaxID=7602 RepID=UPI003AB24FB5
MEYDCIIVGAGVLGSSSAYQLAKDGYKVLLLDQYSLPHSRGSSHGAVRILRYPYSDYRHQTTMPEQHQMWYQLEKEASTVLTHKTPSAIVTPSRNKVFLDKLKIARKSGIACEDLEASQFKERYPMLEFPGCSVFTYSILIIDAHKAVQCLQNEFVKNGGTLLDDEKVLKIEPGPIVTVHTNRGHHFRSKGIILTPGPWASKLLQPLGIDLPLKVWRVNVCYFKEKEPGLYSNVPISLCHADDGCDDIFLFFPSREFPGLVKVNFHYLWDEVDPDERDKSIGKVQQDIIIIKEFVKKHLPGLEPNPSVMEPCMYTVFQKFGLERSGENPFLPCLT